MGSAHNYVNVFAHIVAYLEEYCDSGCSAEVRMDLQPLIQEPARLPTYDEYRQMHPHEQMPELVDSDLTVVDFLARWISEHRSPEYLDGPGHPKDRSKTGAEILRDRMAILVSFLKVVDTK